MTDQVPSSRTPRRARRLSRGLVCVAVFLALLMSIIVGGAFWLRDRDIVVPSWARTKIAEQLAVSLPDLQFDFGDVVWSMDAQWRPRVYVRDVVLRRDDGAPVVAFASLGAQVHRNALLQRQLSLTNLQADGVLISMQRTEEGRIALQADLESDALSGEAQNLPELVANLDEWLLRPGLTQLTEVDIQSVTLRYDDLRADRSWTVDGGRIRLTRTQNRLQIALDLTILGGLSQVATLSANYAGDIGAQASEFGITIANLDARDIASQGPAFAWLGALRAPISGALRGGINEAGGFDPLNATLQIGAGVIQPTAETAPIPIEGAQSYFSYLPQERLLRFDQFSIDTEWGSGQLEGQAHFGGALQTRFDNLVGQFRLSNLRINPANLYPEPVALDAAELDFRLSLSPFLLEVGRLDIQDQGHNLTARGEVVTGQSGWTMALDAQMDQLSPSRLLELWPVGLKPKTRKWIDENVAEGVVQEANAAIRVGQGTRPRISLGFDFEQARVRFLKKMPLIENGRGHASLVKNRFVAVVDEGTVAAPQGGRINAAGTSFVVPDTRAKPDTPGIVRLAAKGPLTAALSLLDLPPLRILEKSRRSLDIATGDVQATGTLSFPLKKGTPPEAVEYDVAGTILNAVSETIVPGRVLTAERLKLQASDEQISLSGAANLSNVPLDFVWTQPIGTPDAPKPGLVTGRFDLSQDALDAFKVTLPPGTLSGAAAARFSIDLVKGLPPALSLSSDLAGARLAVPTVGWSKASERTAILELDVTLSDVPKVERLLLDAPGLFASGTITLDEDRQLERFRLEQLRVGNWLNAPIDLLGRGVGRGLGVEVRGGRIDLRNAKFESGGGAGGPLNVNLDSLQITDTIALTGLNGQFTTSGGLQGDFSGAVNGAAAVTGRVTPQGGRSAVRLTAQNGGRVVSAAGLVQNANAGALVLDLVPVGTGGAFDGKLRVQDARVKNAPTMAALLNAISVVGLINEMNGDGIYFSEVTADFRLAPSRVTIREASAVGASMGLSLDGVLVPKTGQLKLQGVISPVYALNSIGSVLTRRGEGLIGFNFSVTGTTKNPDVFVNPLTALAPAMLRNLFRSAQPDVPLEEGEQAPPPKPRRAPIATQGEDR